MARILLLLVTISLFSQVFAGFCSEYRSEGDLTGYACEGDISHYCSLGENQSEQKCLYGCDSYSGRCEEPDYCEATKNPSGLSFCNNIVRYRIDQDEVIGANEQEAQSTYDSLIERYQEELNGRGLRNVSLSSCQIFIKNFACRATYAECTYFPGLSPHCMTACEDTNTCIVTLFERNNENYTKELVNSCDSWCDFTSGIKSILPSFGAVLLAIIYLLL